MLKVTASTLMVLHIQSEFSTALKFTCCVFCVSLHSIIIKLQ